MHYSILLRYRAAGDSQAEVRRPIHTDAHKGELVASDLEPLNPHP